MTYEEQEYNEWLKGWEAKKLVAKSPNKFPAGSHSDYLKRHAIKKNGKKRKPL